MNGKDKKSLKREDNFQLIEILEVARIPSKILNSYFMKLSSESPH